MFKSLEEPCVLAVDAPWGYGKTTFINFLYKHLTKEEEKYYAIKFNAWESDFAGEPFISLLTQLETKIQKYQMKKLK